MMQFQVTRVHPALGGTSAEIEGRDTMDRLVTLTITGRQLEQFEAAGCKVSGWVTYEKSDNTFIAMKKAPV